MSYVLIALICLATGCALGWLAATVRMGNQNASLSAHLEAARGNEERLEQSLRAANADAAAQSKAAIHDLLSPLRESLSKHQEYVADIERHRLGAYSELK